jgi:bud site selection protein 31
MSFMRRLKGRAPPEGWELLESTIEDFEAQMRDAVAEDHDGKRKNETTWRIHRIHFEKNRFIYDLMYKQQALSKDLVRGLLRPTGRWGTQALLCVCTLVCTCSTQLPVP